MMKSTIYAIILGLAICAFGQGLPIVSEVYPPCDEGDIKWFGWGLTSGDFNGDGALDLAVAAPRSDRPDVVPGFTIPSVGCIFIYYGPLPDEISDPDFIIWGHAENDQFGISIDNSGDVNGDEFDDLLIGANVVGHVGAAYIYYGGPSMDTIPDAAFHGERAVDNFGYSCSGVGDQNGDGLNDFMVGALYNDAGGYRCGRCYLYYGGEPPDSFPDKIFTGLDSLDDFGVVIDGPNDFNGDDDPDFVIGAVQAGGYWYKPGEGYVYLGGGELDTIPDWITSGTHPMEFFGGTVAALGDIDGDGYDDAVFGGYNHDEPVDSGTGRIVVLLGNGSDTLEIIGDRARQYFGAEVSSAGDIDMDGRCEFAVTMTYDPSGDSSGFVQIFGYDAASESVRVDSTCWNPSPATSQWFGYRLSETGDLTGDGIPNFAVTDPRSENPICPSYTTEGVVYVYSGWRSVFPIEAEVLDPSMPVSSCPYQGAVWRLRHPMGLSDIFARIEVEITPSPVPEFQYTLDSAQLEMIDDSTLVYTPVEEWVEFCRVSVELVEAYKTTTGESILDTIDVSWTMDFIPPEINPRDTSGYTNDPYETFIWDIISESYTEMNDIDTSTIIATCGYDTIHPRIFDFPLTIPHDLLSSTVAISISDFGIHPVYGDTFTVCLENVTDHPDILCGPNIAEPNCITKIFDRNWTTDLVFESPGLLDTRLTLGAQITATDGYDAGLDIQMPPVPDTDVKALFSIDDPIHSFIHSLRRDLRNSEDDSLYWIIITEGVGEASLTWDPDALPTGVFLLEYKLDMRSYDRYEFELGDTLYLSFETGPKTIEAYRLLPGAQWNLYSVPYYLESYLPENHFYPIFYYYMYYYAYNSETASYYIPDRIPSGQALWVYILNYPPCIYYPPVPLSVGWPIDTLWAQLHPGWNMIGAPIDSISTGEMGTIPSGTIIPGTVFGYESPSYFSADWLYPEWGYWVLSTSQAELFAPLASRGELEKRTVVNDIVELFGANPPPPPSIKEIDHSIELPHENKITIYPNPFNGTCRISGPGPYRIYDISGKLIEKLSGDESFIWETKSPEGTELPSGIYFIKFSSGNIRKAILVR